MNKFKLFMIAVFVFGMAALHAEEMVMEETVIEETVVEESILPFGVSLMQSVQSDYIWRGYDQAAEGVYQGSGEIAYWELTGNIWYNFDFDNSEINEVDYSITWTHVWPIFDELLNTDLGYIFYDYPNTDANETQELYVAISADVLLTPTFSLYYDFDEIEGTYFSFGISHSIELCDMAALDLYSKIGLENDYSGENGFTHWQLGASLPMSWEVLEGVLVLTPNIDASISLDDDLLDDEFWGGITATMSW